MTNQTMNDDLTLTGGENPLLADRYQVVRQLGAGGMGSVYLVEDTQLDNKLFAVKILPSILVANKRAYRQLKDEALVAMKLVHPNIVQIRAFEENQGNPFLVMDYIEGRTLDDYIAEKGTLSESETVQLLKPIAAALDYAHGEGVVHRDVKPANVMVRKDGRPFILDFGIAREMQDTMTRVTGRLSSGTLQYMSPEQLNGEPPAKAQDIYSFTAMVYECLTGEPPFVRGQIEFQILNNLPPPLPQSVTTWLSSAIMSGLAKNDTERPSSCCKVIEHTNDDEMKKVKDDHTKDSSARECDELYDRVMRLDWQKALKMIGEADDLVAMELTDYEIAVQKSIHAHKRLGRIDMNAITDPYLQFQIGLILYANPVEMNKSSAFEWFEMSAMQKCAPALYMLGRMYEYGESVKQNYDNAKNLFDRALLNFPMADVAIAHIYEFGLDGEEPDVGSAVEWYKYAIEHGSNTVLPLYMRAERSLSSLYPERAKSITPSYANEEYKLFPKILFSVQECIEAANQGRVNEQNLLGWMYLKGDGVQQNYDEAMRWYRKAAEQNSALAQNNLGYMFYGVGNDEEALKWYLKAAEQGHAEALSNITSLAQQGCVEAQYNLAFLYLNGKGVEKNNAEALKWFLKAAEQKNVDAQLWAGVIYGNGNGVPQNFEEAVKWYRAAADQGNAMAQFNLGVMYANGLGVKGGLPVAAEWYRKAAAQGHERAKEALKQIEGGLRSDKTFKNIIKRILN